MTVLQELKQIVGQPGTPGTLPTKYGTVNGGGLPDWSTARAQLDAAQAAAAADANPAHAAVLQAAYTRALQIFNAVDYSLNYRVDLLGDIRAFRHAFNN